MNANEYIAIHLFYIYNSFILHVVSKQQLIQHWFTFIRSVSTMSFNCKATPINDADYRYYINQNCRICFTNHIQGSYYPTLHHQLSIASGVDMHTYTHISMSQQKAILRNQVSADYTFIVYTAILSLVTYCNYFKISSTYRIYPNKSLDAYFL